MDYCTFNIVMFQVCIIVPLMLLLFQVWIIVPLMLLCFRYGLRYVDNSTSSVRSLHVLLSSPLLFPPGIL